ncbi:MAG: hypothetical protein JW953_08120 [Anaerolineae bacterium]|nr:hypothetical protein [Anaerolineae bacterium]
MAIPPPPRLPGLSHTFVLGLLLGLAGMSKYNALPLCPLVGGWGFWLACQKWRDKTGSLSAKIKRLLQSLSVFSLGVVLTAGWWPAFVWYHFNEVETLGLLRGSLAAFTSSTHDTTLRQVAAGASFSLPSFSDWWAWLVTLFKSFWGLFGGGGAIELPAWAYGSLAVFCLLAVIGLVNKIFRPQPSSFRLPPSSLLLFFLTPLFFLPLPLLRFILTGANVAESAQGRHLFPALPAITLALVWGLSAFHEKFLTGNSGHQGQTPIRNPQYGIGNILARLHLMKIIFPLFSLWLSLYALALIQADFPPPIPLRTTPDAATAKNLLNAPLAKGVTLVGYELHQVEGRFLPLTLVWQAEAIPSQDYLINLTLTGPAGQLLGGWLGHPLGGRYPTRTWDKGDILRDTIPIPLLPHASAAGVTLSLQLLDPQEQPVSVPLTLTPALSLPAQLSSAPVLPPQLRADGLSPASPFTYRSTLSFILPGASDPPILNDPSGQVFTPTRFLSGPGGGIAHFIVAAHWPGGSYQLSLLPGSLFSIHNRPRQFEPPPMAYPLNANFAGAITLLGYDLPQRRVQPGQSFPVTLHLRAERTLGQNLVIFNHLLDQNAGQRGGEDRIPLKYYTTLLWVPGEIVSDAYDVPVETAAPPGVYWLDVGFYPANQPHTSLPLFVEGQPIDRNSVRLGPLKVGGPPPGITVSGINPQQFVKQSFGRQITLIGFNLADLDHHPLDPSQPVPPNLQLALFWQADNIPPADYTVFVHLLNPAGHLVASFDSPPAGGAYPTSLWDPGEIIADQRRLSNLPPGSYTLQAGLYRPDTGERLPTPGSLDGAVSLMDFVVE